VSLENASRWESRVDSVPTIVATMRDRNAPLDSGNGWSVEGGWQSFKADFVTIRRGDDTVTLKFGDNWSVDDPTFVASEIARVRRLLAELPGGGVRMPAALGWSDDPPAVALETVTGRRLFDVVRAMDDPDRVADLVTRSGRAIGAYHRAQPAPPDRAAATAAAGDLRSAARRVLVRGSLITPLESTLDRARGYRFSPNDFLVDETGGLVLLDPPHVRKYDYIHRDLGAFLYELHRACAGERPAKGASRASLDALRVAFLDGYADESPDSAIDAVDVWVMDLYSLARVSMLAYNRARSGKVTGALRATRWAVMGKARLGSPPARAPWS
jgi:hypothetical protein